MAKSYPAPLGGGARRSMPRFLLLTLVMCSVLPSLLHSPRTIDAPRSRGPRRSMVATEGRVRAGVAGGRVGASATGAVEGSAEATGAEIAGAGSTTAGG